MFKIGDKVFFSTGTYEKLKIYLGIIIDIKDEKYATLHRPYNSVYLIEEKYIESLTNIEKVKQDIIDHYTPKIEELKGKLKKVSAEEKRQERLDKYNSIRSRILKNCERILVCIDDDEFENRLKEINDLKKQLHTIDLECGDIIRKANGEIKYNIKNIEKQMNSHLFGVSEESILKAFKY